MPDDKPLLAKAFSTAEGLDWNSDPWHALTATLKDSTGRKGRGLFLPLRQALTGRDTGPEMGPLVQLMGKELVLKRLQLASRQ